MKIPRPAEWRAAGALHGVLVATVVSALSGCKNEEPPGVFLEFRADSAQFRPEAIRFTWMRAGAELVNARLPEVGSFTSTGSVLGSIFIETGGPLSEPRLLAVKGLRGDTEALTGQLVSGAAVVVPASADPVQRWAVMLEEPLADENGDGRPDVVHRCLRERWPACLDGVGPAPTPPDDGGVADASPDGATPADTATPADAPVALNEGLIGYWKLDEGMGVQARDSSGSNNNGSLRSLPPSAWMPGKQGTGLEIPRTDGSAVVVPDSASLDGLRPGFTFAAWTFRMGHRPNYATVLSRQYQSSGSEHYLLGFQNGTLKALVNSYLPQGGEATLTAAGQAPLFTWVHVALSFDGATARLYQDGKLVASAGHTQAQMPDTTPLCLGCNENGPDDDNDETLGGRLDEVVVYSRALSAAEVARLAAGDLPRGM
jgi:hypothetical protein